jgi:hypothetical protein
MFAGELVWRKKYEKGRFQTFVVVGQCQLRTVRSKA